MGSKSFGIADEPSTWAIMDKYPVLREFCDRLHGSGIDFEWYAEETKAYVFLFNAFHCMNEAGMYVTSQNFKIAFLKADITDFKVHCTDRTRYWWDRTALGDYIPDAARQALDDAIAKLSKLAPVDSGFRETKVYQLTEARPRPATDELILTYLRYNHHYQDNPVAMGVLAAALDLGLVEIQELLETMNHDGKVDCFAAAEAARDMVYLKRESDKAFEQEITPEQRAERLEYRKRYDGFMAEPVWEPLAQYAWNSADWAMHRDLWDTIEAKAGLSEAEKKMFRERIAYRAKKQQTTNYCGD